MRKYSNISSGATIARGVLILFSSKIMGLLLGLLQFLLVAHAFGMGLVTDAYIVAQTIPRFSRGIVEGGLNSTFLPVLVEHRGKNGEYEAWKITRTIFFISAVILIIFSLLTIFFAPQISFILAPGFSPESLNLSSYLLRIMSPMLLLIFLSLLLSAVFHSYNNFFVPSMAALLPQAGGIIALVIFADSMGIVSLPLGIIVATIMQLLLLLFFLRKYKPGEKSHISLNHAGVKQIGRLIGPRFLGFSLDGMNLFVDRLFASLLGSGLVSALTFAQTIVRIPHNFVAGSLGRAMMPTLSLHSINKEYDDIKKLLSKSIRMISFVTIPVIIFTAIFREDLIRLLFQRGAFTAESTHLTAYALLFYSFSVLAYSVNPVLKIVFYAMQDTVTPLKVGIMAIVSNAILDYVLMKFMGHGGIALATSIVATFNTAALWYCLSGKIGAIDKSLIFRSMLRTFLISFSIGFFFKFIYPYLHLGKYGFFWDSAGMTCLLIIGGVLFWGSCIFFNIKEYREIMDMAQNRRGNKNSKIKREILAD